MIYTGGMSFKTNDGVYSYPVQIEKLINVSGDGFTYRQPFVIKNITEKNISLMVRLYGSDTPIETIFYPGYNLEVVIEIVDTIDPNTIQVGM